MPDQYFLEARTYVESNFKDNSGNLTQAAIYPWTQIWDALFWEFLNNHRDFFSSNPRLGMLLKTYDRMSDDKKATLTTSRKFFLGKLGI